MWAVAGSVGPSRVGTRPATAMMAATTRSTGMTSTMPSGTPGNSLQQSAGVGEDDRLGHPEAADPARPGLGQRGLDDRGPHDADRVHVAHGPHGAGHRDLAEGLGEGVGVGPADRRGAGTSGLDHAVVHPVAGGCARSAPTGSGRRRRPARRGPRAPNSARRSGVAALGLDVAPGNGGRRGDLAAPVEADGERAVLDRLLGGGAAAVAGDVAGADGDEVGRDAELVEQLGDADRAEEVDLDRPVEGGVERDGRRRVDDHVAAGQRGAARTRPGRGRRCRRRPTRR